MTNKENALNILRYKKADRMPVVHFGYWQELLIEWANEGHISIEQALNWSDGNKVDKELDKIIGWDFNWSHCVSGNHGLMPTFPYKELSTDSEGFITYINSDGLIEKKRAGACSIPAEVDYTLKDRAIWESEYLPRLQFSMERIPLNYLTTTYAKEERDYPVALHLGSVLGEIRNMLSMLGLSYTMCDDYELLEEIVDTYADMQYKVAEATLATGAKFDFAHYWEDICFKNGPLVSPLMFKNLCAKHYKKRNELCAKYGLDIISMDCDGVIDMLLPIWLENGVNTIFPLEVGTWGANIAPFRAKYGKIFRAVGGMDKTKLRIDKASIDKEIERLKPLIDLGGYIPCPDHRLMPGTKFALVEYYIEEIRKIRV